MRTKAACAKMRAFDLKESSMSHVPHNIAYNTGMTPLAGNGKAAIRLTCPAVWVGTANVREDAPR